ncbi:hypothetical protein [Sulfitobacter guttiformis]|nr:hypothetical protein [Sulfitobacter guttiformis]KIN72500.1 AMP-dependent synthetase and ligase [Sulfitobacter guttiformis KCTC 32187]
MASWDGRAVDERGILRILNENGTRSPLFWIFNGAPEPARLAKCLGDDQPLIYSRSSHLLVRPGDDPMDIRNILARYLACELCQHFPEASFDIGTSCQGSTIAMAVCNLLREAGKGVGHLCLINCSLPEIVTDRPALLVYGDQDTASNPFHKDPVGAGKRAKSAFSEYEKYMVRAEHGQFYSEGTVEMLIDRFYAFRSRVAGSGEAKRALTA